MTEMIDRIAIRLQSCNSSLTSHDASILARVAVASLLAPTDEMMDLHPPFVQKSEFLASYRAMIDAALGV